MERRGKSMGDWGRSGNRFGIKSPSTTFPFNSIRKQSIQTLQRDLLISFLPDSLPGSLQKVLTPNNQQSCPSFWKIKKWNFVFSNFRDRENLFKVRRRLHDGDRRPRAWHQTSQRRGLCKQESEFPQDRLLCPQSPHLHAHGRIPRTV